MDDSPPLKAPLLSIIIPIKNRAYSIPCTLSSLGKLISVAEIVVVDDCSDDLDDGVCHLISSFADIFVTSLQAGANACRNLGVDISNGEILWFLDSDDLALPENILAVLQRIDRTQANSVWLGDYYWVRDIYGLPRPGHSDMSSLAQSIQRNPRHALYHHWLPTSCIFIPRTVFYEAGGLDLKRSSGQETDLFRRLGEQGTGFNYISLPVFTFIRHNGESIYTTKRRDARYDATETMSTYLSLNPGDKERFRSRQWANRIVMDELLCPGGESSQRYAWILARKYRPGFLVLLRASRVFPNTLSKAIRLYNHLRGLLRARFLLRGMLQGIKWLAGESIGKEFNSHQKKPDILLHNFRYFRNILKMHREKLPVDCN